MAKLRTPLMGFSARGQIAKSVVAYKWKSLNCLRAYVIPSDPKTPAQLAQRATHRTAHEAWRDWYADSNTRAAWDLFKRTYRRKGAGYNAYMSNAIREINRTPDPFFVTNITRLNPLLATAYMSRLTDQGTQPPKPFYDIYAGLNPLDMSHWSTVQMNDFTRLNISLIPAFGTWVFLQVKSGDLWVSGIHKVKLIL